MAFIDFCNHYRLQFINLASSTICYYVTYLTRRFTSAKSIRQYISGIRLFLHQQLGLAVEALHSFLVTCLLHTADVSMHTSPLRSLPIQSPLLHQLCEHTSCISMLETAMRVFLAFTFFGMLRQSNLALSSSHQFDPTRHTGQGDIIFAPPGLLIRDDATPRQPVVLLQPQLVASRLVGVSLS